MLVCALALAAANGANDNFKGVATLWRRAGLRHRAALRLATAATFAGGLAASVLAAGLLARFTGMVLFAASFEPGGLAAATAAAAVLVVGSATALGLPVSTTHALLGALLGAGWAAGADIRAAALWRHFLAPLLVAPPLAAASAAVLWRCARPLAVACWCRLLEPDGGGTARWRSLLGTRSRCGGGAAAVTLDGGRLLRAAHAVSAAAACFARGANDAPKLAALLVLAGVGRTDVALAVTAAAMAAGGWLGGRRLALRLSRRLARLDDGAAASANFATAGWVLAGGLAGLPLSTTHVAVGAIAGAARRLSGRDALQILGAWGLTLPVAALLAAAAQRVLG
ncbi:MAG: hypothetical protein KatS3mg121_0323 [Gammaproteobacteria bacterium]|nr:MAG: hypothetical protein KatS3mg121_0323 [Gammaproteobacteria bacterium]